MSRSDRIMRAINRVLKAGLLWWAVIGLAIWMFLAWPYLNGAIVCVLDYTNGGVQSAAGCLKPVAADLREDQVIATYATATVAAAIALQLGQRRNSGRKDRSRRRLG